MAETKISFSYPPSLQEYSVTEHEYLRQHPDIVCVCTGAVVFNQEGKMLLVQRAKEESAFPNLWEIPGGKVDDTDETLLHAAARELQEETGLVATRIVQKVQHFDFNDERPGRPPKMWRKLIFHIEVRDMADIALDPVEHQAHVFASEEEIVEDLAGDVQLVYISPQNKAVKLEAFRLQQEAAGQMYQ